MKMIRSTLTGALIACATVQAAQNIPTDTQDSTAQLTVTDLTHLYRSEHRTISAGFSPTNGLTLVELTQFYQPTELLPGHGNTAAFVYIPTDNAETEHSGTIQRARDVEKAGTMALNEPEDSIFADYNGNDLVFWTRPEKKPVASKAAAEIQTISISPENPHENILSHTVRIPEDGYYLTYRKPNWYYWLKPDRILMKWADYWTTGTPEATPVVLMAVGF